jgi:hypothetical protein
LYDNNFGYLILQKSCVNKNEIEELKDSTMLQDIRLHQQSDTTPSSFYIVVNYDDNDNNDTGDIMIYYRSIFDINTFSS